MPLHGQDNTVRRVTVIVPALNEAPYIARCLEHLLAQDYPAQHMEILVIDGGSSDGTREIVQAYTTRTSQIRLLTNPSQRVGAALNIGLAHATGEIVVRVDAHTFVAPDYVRQCVHYLTTESADAVGGVLNPVGDTHTGEVIAAVLAHPLGGGPARFRHARRAMWVDTVYLGAWRRRTLVALGGFNASLEANEDYELFYRLRQAGGRILCHPRIRSQTVTRPTLRALWHQYVRYGRGKAQMLHLHPRALQFRQLPAPTLVALGMLLGGIGVFYPQARWGFALVLGVYSLVMGVVAARLARRLGWQRWAKIWLTFWVLHWGWGIGFWTQWIICLVRRRKCM